MKRLPFRCGGTLPIGELAVVRPEEQQLAAALRAGEFCAVYAPPQSGKSSLALRAAEHLQHQGVRTATLDAFLVLLARKQQPTKAAVYCDFALALQEELRPGSVDEEAMVARWHKTDSPDELLAAFLRELRDTGPLALLLDEIDAFVLESPYAANFLAVVRAACGPGLGVCLLGFGLTPRRPPVALLDIGHEFLLGPLDRAELAPLAAGLAGLGDPPDVLLDEVYRWTQGHAGSTGFLCNLLTIDEYRENRDRTEGAAARVARLAENLTRLHRDILGLGRWSLSVPEKRLLPFDKAVLLRRWLRAQGAQGIHSSSGGSPF